MSEVKRYAIWASPVSDGPTWVEFTQDLRSNFPDAKGYVREEEFDRVTANLKAALGREAVLLEDLQTRTADLLECGTRRKELQQRPTAADDLLTDAVALLECVTDTGELTREKHSVLEAEICGVVKRFWSRERAALKPAEGRNSPTCTWSEGGFSWHTSCGKEWQFTDGGLPAENGMHFCHSCGKTLVVESVGGGDEFMPLAEVAQFNDDHDGRPERDD